MQRRNGGWEYVPSELYVEDHSRDIGNKGNEVDEDKIWCSRSLVARTWLLHSRKRSSVESVCSLRGSSHITTYNIRLSEPCLQRLTLRTRVWICKRIDSENIHQGLLNTESIKWASATQVDLYRRSLSHWNASSIERANAKASALWRHWHDLSQARSDVIGPKRAFVQALVSKVCYTFCWCPSLFSLWSCNSAYLRANYSYMPQAETVGLESLFTMLVMTDDWLLSTLDLPSSCFLLPHPVISKFIILMNAFPNNKHLSL